MKNHNGTNRKWLPQSAYSKYTELFDVQNLSGEEKSLHWLRQRKLDHLKTVYLHH
jgi:hypothetical protein